MDSEDWYDRNETHDFMCGEEGVLETVFNKGDDVVRRVRQRDYLKMSEKFKINKNFIYKKL